MHIKINDSLHIMESFVLMMKTVTIIVTHNQVHKDSSCFTGWTFDTFVFVPLLRCCSCSSRHSVSISLERLLSEVEVLALTVVVVVVPVWVLGSMVVLGIVGSVVVEVCVCNVLAVVELLRLLISMVVVMVWGLIVVPVVVVGLLDV
jgi:hypothetical protein